LYVNGASDTTGTLSLNLGNHSAKIGALASSIETFNGKIDQVRIFDTALSSSDVTKLYNEAADIPTTNLVAH
jgi:outer membrane murein-binding lipoprotein Lpp